MVRARQVEEIEAARAEGARQRNKRVEALPRDLEARETERGRLAALVAESDEKFQALVKAKDEEASAALAETEAVAEPLARFSKIEEILNALDGNSADYSPAVLTGSDRRMRALAVNAERGPEEEWSFPRS